MFKIIFLLAIHFFAFNLNAQENLRNLELNWKTDTTKKSVDLNQFKALMLPDGIPPIDQPNFISANEAATIYFSDEPVISVVINGKAKAYPLSVLTFHEIVNDSLEDEFFTVTYCPLCNSSVVYDRKLSVNDSIYLLDFGVSGMLRKSDMVMYDRQTQSWWQQLTGEALVGELVGSELGFISSSVISIATFFSEFPSGNVLARPSDTEFTYGTNPYVGYDDLSNEQPRLFKEQVDKRLPAMERIISLSEKEVHKAYPMSVISKKKIIKDEFSNKQIVIFYSDKMISILDKKNFEESKNVGSVRVFDRTIDNLTLDFKYKKGKIIDIQTKSEWDFSGKCIDGIHKGKQLDSINYGSHFAFAWFAFHEDSELYND